MQGSQTSCSAGSKSRLRSLPKAFLWAFWGPAILCRTIHRGWCWGSAKASTTGAASSVLSTKIIKKLLAKLSEALVWQLSPSFASCSWNNFSMIWVPTSLLTQVSSKITTLLTTELCEFNLWVRKDRGTLMRELEIRKESNNNSSGLLKSCIFYLAVKEQINYTSHLVESIWLLWKTYPEVCKFTMPDKPECWGRTGDALQSSRGCRILCLGKLDPLHNYPTYMS